MAPGKIFSQGPELTVSQNRPMVSAQKLGQNLKITFFDEIEKYLIRDCGIL